MKNKLRFRYPYNLYLARSNHKRAFRAKVFADSEQQEMKNIQNYHIIAWAAGGYTSGCGVWGCNHHVPGSMIRKPSQRASSSFARCMQNMSATLVLIMCECWLCATQTHDKYERLYFMHVAKCLVCAVFPCSPSTPYPPLPWNNAAVSVETPNLQ